MNYCSVVSIKVLAYHFLQEQMYLQYLCDTRFLLEGFQDIVAGRQRGLGLWSHVVSYS